MLLHSPEYTIIPNGNSFWYYFFGRHLKTYVHLNRHSLIFFLCLPLYLQFLLAGWFTARQHRQKDQEGKVFPNAAHYNLWLECLPMTQHTYINALSGHGHTHTHIIQNAIIATLFIVECFDSSISSICFPYYIPLNSIFSFSVPFRLPCITTYIIIVIGIQKYGIRTNI